MPALLDSSTSSWIIDSRVSSHMSCTQKLFTRLSNLSRIKTVSIANGHHYCSVFGEGVIDASSHITIEKVLHVPDFLINLLSIGAITCQHYCSVTFSPYHCSFQDLQTGRRIDLGREQGRGVYLLVWDDIPSGLASVATTAESSLLWHCRLRHPSHRSLQQALSWISVESFICELCRLGKQHQATYKRSSLSTSQGPFDLIHCDIWGLLVVSLCLFSLLYCVCG